tara:strand:- start:3533 stop:3832 length:300 start_codon:yes stop_codon:yes gene_type:complete
MRHVYGTKNTSTSNVSVQLVTDSAVRVVSLTVKARSTNSAAMFVGFDSGVSSNAGWELTAGKDKTVDYGSFSATVKGTNIWANCSDTAAKIDFIVITEN